MFAFIRSLFSGLIYIQIWEKRIKVSNVSNGIVFDETPLIAIGPVKSEPNAILAIGDSAKDILSSDSVKVTNPFSHPRMLVREFEKAEKIIQHAIREVHQAKYLRPNPKVVIQPMEKLEGGLSDVEVRVFHELALGAGARETVVHTGGELSVHSFNYEEISKNSIYK